MNLLTQALPGGIRAIPAVEDEGVVVHGKNAALRYLATKYCGRGRPQWFPEDLRLRTLLEEMLDLAQKIGAVLKHLVYHLSILTVGDNVDYLDHPVPVQMMQKELWSMIDIIEHKILVKNRGCLFLVNEQMSIADISLLSELLRITMLPVFNWTEYPKLSTWVDHVSNALTPYFYEHTAHLGFESGSSITLTRHKLLPRIVDELNGEEQRNDLCDDLFVNEAFENIDTLSSSMSSWDAVDTTIPFLESRFQSLSTKSFNWGSTCHVEIDKKMLNSGLENIVPLLSPMTKNYRVLDQVSSSSRILHIPFFIQEKTDTFTQIARFDFVVVQSWKTMKDGTFRCVLKSTNNFSIPPEKGYSRAQIPLAGWTLTQLANNLPSGNLRYQAKSIVSLELEESLPIWASEKISTLNFEEIPVTLLNFP